MQIPRRVQRKRVKGYKLPSNTKSVTRPGPYGNIYPVGGQFPERLNCYKWYGDGSITLENSLEAFECLVENKLCQDPKWLEPLRDHNLACFCPVWKCSNGHTFDDGDTRLVYYMVSEAVNPRGEEPGCCADCSSKLQRVPCHADILIKYANRN